jgi:hypothetical protein
MHMELADHHSTGQMRRTAQVDLVLNTPGGPSNTDLTCREIHVDPPSFFMADVGRLTGLGIDPRLRHRRLHHRIGQ